MKKCQSCAKDIPDTAFHCVFCGAKQGSLQTAGPAQRTIMGYAAADLQKLLPNQQGPQAHGGYVPAAGPADRTMMAGVGGGPLPQPGADQRTMMGGVGGQQLPPTAGPEQRTMPAGIPNHPEQRTMMAGAPAPMGGGQPMYQQPMQHMGYSPSPTPMSMQSSSGQRPQYLASQAAARDMAPSEPWAASLRSMMIIFGLILVATVVLPLSLDPMTFMWKILTTGAAMQAKLWPLVLGAGGLLCLLFGLLPVPTAARGIVAAIVGILPFIVMAIAGPPGPASPGALPFGGWMGYALMVGIILAPTGLLLRSQYTTSSLSRILSLIGCGAILVLFLIPQGGTLPVVGMLRTLGNGGVQLLGTLWLLALAAAAGLGLILTLIPARASMGTGFFAWVIIAWLFGAMIISLLIIAPFSGGSVLPVLKSPATIAMIFDMLAWPALAAYGLATTFGKSLEV